MENNAANLCTTGEPGKIALETRKSRRLEVKRENERKEIDILGAAKGQAFNKSQSASPLYNLPQEIRDAIFELVLTSYEDTSRLYDLGFIRLKHYYNWAESHPGVFYHRIDTALLRTCRLIYSETRFIPVAISSHILHYTPNFTLLSPLSESDTKYLGKLTSEQLAAVQHIHIVAKPKYQNPEGPKVRSNQTLFLELDHLRHGFHPERGGRNGPFPKTFTITISHTDWKRSRIYRKDCPKLCLNHMLDYEHWDKVFGGLKVLRMELEVEEEEGDLAALGMYFSKQHLFR
jgi:hypothetical protein